MGAGPVALYHLQGGQVIWCENAADKGEYYELDGRKSCLISIVSTKGNQAQLQMSVLSETGFKAEKVRLMKASVLMVTNTTDDMLMGKINETLSGLIMPGVN